MIKERYLRGQVVQLSNTVDSSLSSWPFLGVKLLNLVTPSLQHRHSRTVEQHALGQRSSKRMRDRYEKYKNGKTKVNSAIASTLVQLS